MEILSTFAVLCAAVLATRMVEWWFKSHVRAMRRHRGQPDTFRARITAYWDASWEVDKLKSLGGRVRVDFSEVTEDEDGRAIGYEFVVPNPQKVEVRLFTDPYLVVTRAEVTRRDDDTDPVTLYPAMLGDRYLPRLEAAIGREASQWAIRTMA